MILPDDKATREQAAEIVKAGGVIAFRTDTFYGLGADPFNPKAVQRIGEQKGGERKPILIVISDRAEVDRFVVKQSRAFTLAADAFWPGPLTLVGLASAPLPQELTAATGTIGVRLPDDDSVRALVRLCGGALTGTSANLSGRPPAESAQQVQGFFGESIDLVIDSGTTQTSQASTVLDVSRPVPKIIREGVIPRAKLEKVLGSIIEG